MLDRFVFVAGLGEELFMLSHSQMIAWNEVQGEIEVVLNLGWVSRGVALAIAVSSWNVTPAVHYNWGGLSEE